MNTRMIKNIYLINLKKANDYKIVIKDDYRFMIGLEATHSGVFGMLPI